MVKRGKVAHESFFRMNHPSSKGVFVNVLAYLQAIRTRAPSNYYQSNPIQQAFNQAGHLDKTNRLIASWVREAAGVVPCRFSPRQSSLGWGGVGGSDSCGGGPSSL